MERTHAALSDEDLFRVFRGTVEEKHAAFAELYARYSHKVYVYCLRMAGNPDEANDVFQETFLRFFRHEFRPAERVSNILSYLLTSARNVFLNTKRGNARWSPFEEGTDVVSMPMYEREELFNMVGAALDLLDASYREAFVLRFYQGLSYKEIAEITGDSVASLKVRVMRAKDRIRSILSPYITDLTRHE